MKHYPGATSRTLNPDQRSFQTVVAKHDKRITDADLNLIQDLRDWKTQRLVENTTFSGVLSDKPFSFNTSQEGVLYIPAMDVLLNGEVVRIGGSRSQDLGMNKVVFPTPKFWSYGQADSPLTLYVVLLEMWYRCLNPDDAAGVSGYYIDGQGNRFIYANGCVDCDSANLLADDAIDPFQSLNTTSRVQIQWRLRPCAIPTTYDFTTLRYGLDPVGDSTDTLFGQAYLSSAPSSADAYKFTNMGAINGDYGLWRSGPDTSSLLPTLDGYAYALPIAVYCQRNAGVFAQDVNPHGCASALVAGSGLLHSGLSGRYDLRYADVVYPEDIVDTRLTVSLKGYDFEVTAKTGFVSLVNGDLQQKIGRGEAPGSDSLVVGSRLPYSVRLGSALNNTENLGTFDGYMNGFGADARTFTTTKAITVSQKSTGQLGYRWTKGDAFTIDLDTDGVRPGATVNSLLVQASVAQADGKTLKPVLLMSGQISFVGLGTRKASATILRDLQGSAFDPGVRDLYVTVGVLYPAGSSYTLQKTPYELAGGRLFDAAINQELPVFGVSEYSTTKSFTTQTNPVVVYNPQYSHKVFGTRVELVVPASSGTTSTVSGINYVTFTVPRTGLNSQFSGIYAAEVRNKTNGTIYPITSTQVDPGNIYVTLQAIPTTATVVISVLLNQTAQLAYNAPVKAVSSISETVLFGNYSTNALFQMDKRVKLLCQVKDSGTGISTLLFATNGATLSGISGNAADKFIFAADTPASPELFTAYPVLDAKFFNGYATITVASTVAVDQYPYFFVGSLFPAFSATSNLTLTLHYLPYQGEGDPSHTYTLLHSEDTALVTTNGTGAAPIVGLRDVYPYNRELPITASLPSQTTWNDAELSNQPVSNYFDSNYEAKRMNNVEHTFSTLLHTNDFIQPVGSWVKKQIQFSFSTGRGFAKATPHVGFAINPPKLRSTLGSNTMSTSSSMTLYVNNVHGSDAQDGYTAVTAKKTIAAALALLPPILRHPCYVYITDTKVPYKLTDLASLSKVFFGDGDNQPVVDYCMGSIAHSVQDAGRLYIGRSPESTGYPEISALGYVGYGDGPTHAFVIRESQAIFSGLAFTNFVSPAIYAVDSYVDFIDCQWTNCFIAGSITDGCTASISKGSCAPSLNGTGFILEDSALTASALSLNATNQINAMFVCERTSNLTLTNHTVTDDTSVTVLTPVVLAKLGSTVVCTKSYSSSGNCSIYSNSVLTRTTTVSPFAGGVISDASASTVTDVS